MDPEAIKKRIVQKAQKERAQQIKERNEIEENKQRLKNIEIKAFAEANAVLSQIVNDLPIKKDVKITKTDAALTIYWPSFGGGSDTYKYFYNSSAKKLCLRHISEFGVYLDDFGASSYDFQNPSNNQSISEVIFDTLEDLLENFEKTIKKFVFV